MSNKRFVIKSTATELELYDNGIQIGEFPHFEWVAKSVDLVVDLLNKQEDTIITLKRRLEKINNGYGDLTHRNGLTANEWLIESQEKELKKKNEQISEWIKQHSKDIAKISEQNKLIQNLKEENEQLRREHERVCVQNSLLSDELNVLKRLTVVDTARRFLNE